MVVFGLSFAQAVIVILIGNLFYGLTGLASLQGPQAGTTAFGVSRASFGPNGNRLPSFFNWVTQVGFEIEGIALIVFAAILLTSKAGFTAGVAAKVIFIILAVAIQAVLPLLGHAAVLKVLRWLAIPFIILFAVLAGLAAGKVNLHVPAHGASWGALTIFLALVISAAAWAGPRTATTTRGTCHQTPAGAASCSRSRSAERFRRCCLRSSAPPSPPECRVRPQSMA